MESPLKSHLDMVTLQKSQKEDKVRAPKGCRRTVKKLQGIPKGLMIHGQRLDQFYGSGASAVPRKRRERIVLVKSRAEEADSGSPRHSSPEVNTVSAQDVMPDPISSQGWQYQSMGHGADAMYPDDFQNPFPFHYLSQIVHPPFTQHPPEGQTLRSLSFIGQAPTPQEEILFDIQSCNTDSIDVHYPTGYPWLLQTELQPERAALSEAISQGNSM